MGQIYNFPAAVNVRFSPAGTIAATNTQAAVEEVDSEKAPKASPTFTGTATADGLLTAGTKMFCVESTSAALPAGRTGQGLEWFNTGVQSYNRTTAAYGTFNVDALSISFRPGGVLAVQIDNSGNMGVGAAPASDTKLDVTKDANEALKIRFRNIATGTASFVQYSCSAGSTTIWNYAFSQGYTTSGRFIASSALVESNGSEGIGLSATSGPIRLWTGSTERARIDTSGNLQMGGTNTVITSARHPQLRSYTVGTLPSASTAGQLIYVSDGTSNKRLAVSDGTNWRWPDGAIVS
jgi:hypothetical protein